MENLPVKKLFYKKKWFIFVVIFAILAVIGSFSSNEQPEESYVAVTNVTTNSGFDDEADEWFWGANFKVDLPESTKLNCLITALDASGRELATYQRVHNVSKSGIAVLYGEEVLPAAEETVVKAISSFDIKCSKA